MLMAVVALVCILDHSEGWVWLALVLGSLHSSPSWSAAPLSPAVSDSPVREKEGGGGRGREREREGGREGGREEGREGQRER